MNLNMNEYFENIGNYNNYAPPSKEKSEELKLIEFTMRTREDIQTILPESLQFMRNEIELNSNINHSLPDQKKESKKVLIMPIVQFNPIKENDDKDLLMELLSDEILQKLTISSAYINFPDFLINKLKLLNCEIELITSSPQANSFYRAGRIKGNIPKFYRLFELNMLKAFKGKENIHLYEFKRDTWTYHSKGMWFYEHSKEVPNATLIGSSNYNIRSYERDLELQFFMYSFCDKMNFKLENEVKDNFLDCYEIEENFLKKDREMRITFKTRLLAKILRKYL